MQGLIRPYQTTDLDDVLCAWENASELAHPFMPYDFMESERYNIPNVYLPNTDTWVYETEGRVVGFISLIGNEVGALFVQPLHHGTGVGRQLMDKAQELHGGLEVEVFEKNKIGRKFYARYGFVLLEKKSHEETDNTLLRLKFFAPKTGGSNG